MFKVTSRAQECSFFSPYATRCAIVCSKRLARDNQFALCKYRFAFLSRKAFIPRTRRQSKDILENYSQFYWMPRSSLYWDIEFGSFVYVAARGIASGFHYVCSSDRAICIDNSSRAHPESVLCVIKRSCDFRWHWLGSCDDFGTKNGHLLFKRTVNWRTNIKAITKTFSRAICLRCSHWKNYNEQRNKYFYYPGALFGQKSPSGRHLILETAKNQPHSWKPLRFSIAQSISHFWRAWQVWREVFRVNLTDGESSERSGSRKGSKDHRETWAKNTITRTFNLWIPLWTFSFLWLVSIHSTSSI